MAPRVTVGPPSGEDDLDALTAILDRTYLRSPEDAKAWRNRIVPDDIRVVRSQGRVAGGLSLLPMGQWFGGRVVPMTGVASVGVDPEHRASGLASELMRRVLEELAESGSALSALYPATQPVYRRTGYELAGTFTRLKVPCAAIDVRDRTLDVRRVEPDDARELIEPLYRRRAEWTNGHLQRPERMWRRMLSSERGEAHVYTVGPPDALEGYVVFGQSREGDWKYTLGCRDFVALTAAASRRLWTFFADHRSFAEAVRWIGPPNDPVLYALREQDWSSDWSWTWMLRLVDVRAALAGRGYPPGLEAELHLEVRDDVLQQNARRFVITVADGDGHVRAGGRGRIRIDVRGLAALYSGFSGAAELVPTGYVEGPEADLARATAVFAGPAPWLPDFF